jgi:phosphoribosylformylglycinamidine synthase PurS subunit
MSLTFLDETALDETALDETAMKARVHVMLKPGVLDPQGKAIGNALSGLGFKGIGEVRQGKLIELELAESDPAQARAQVEAMCKELLANPVIEHYTIDIDPAP